MSKGRAWNVAWKRNCEEAEFKKRELENAEERGRNKAELARKIEKMQAEMKMKKVAADLEIEREQLRSELSD